MTDVNELRVYKGQLRERELIALKALVNEGLDDDTDAQFLFLSLKRSLDAFVLR